MLHYAAAVCYRLGLPLSCSWNTSVDVKASAEQREKVVGWVFFRVAYSAYQSVATKQARFKFRLGYAVGINKRHLKRDLYVCHPTPDVS
jgi:hypothetical protein